MLAEPTARGLRVGSVATAVWDGSVGTGWAAPWRTARAPGDRPHWDGDVTRDALPREERADTCRGQAFPPTAGRRAAQASMWRGFVEQGKVRRLTVPSQGRAGHRWGTHTHRLLQGPVMPGDAR